MSSNISGASSPSASERALAGATAIEPPNRESGLGSLVLDAVSSPQVARPNEPFSQWSRRYVARLALADSVLGGLTMAAALLLPQAMLVDGVFQVLVAMAGLLVWPAAVAASRGYTPSNVGVGGEEVRSLMRAVSAIIVATALPVAVFDEQRILLTVVLATVAAAAGSFVIRLFARRHLHRKQRSGVAVRRVILVGGVWAAADLAGVLDREPESGMKVIGVCVPDTDADAARGLGLTVLGSLSQVRDLVRVTGADAVAVTGGESTRHNYLRELTWTLEGEDVELLVHPGLIEVAGPRMHIRPYVGLPLLHVEQPNFTAWRRLVKRTTDLCVTSVGLLLTSPLFLLIALAIKLGDGGPVVFRQTRVGLDGSTFTILKFRSMHVDAERRLAELRAANPHLGVMFKLQEDPRITPVGRFLRRYSLDELPQLLNVVAGQMSLVGPRPPLPSEVDAYASDARRRLLVTPGLTGLWQVNGRSLLSWEETVRLDLRYVENWTLALDLLILWKTFFAVVAKKGAF